MEIRFDSLKAYIEREDVLKIIDEHKTESEEG